jgi:hypothetical protein
MARSKLTFGKFGDAEHGTRRHTLPVQGDPETVVNTLRAGWAQLNRAQEGDPPEWVWVNEAQVLYVESVQDDPSD